MSEICSIYSQSLRADEFNTIRRYIQENCGIRLPENKKNMVEGRIRKRLKALGMTTYGEYIDYVFDMSNPVCGREQMELIDVITTNKTDFFREINHFNYLSSKVLNKYAAKGYGSTKCLNVWSSACSTGEEPYTMAMVLAEYFGIDGNYRVYATDINSSVLEKGRNAIYSADKTGDIPFELKKKYMLKSKNRVDIVMHRFRPEIREKVIFGRLNLMDADYCLPVEMDIVFCRNVIIYFDHNTQCEIIKKLCSNIPKGGYLFLGHSETVHGMELPLVTEAPTVFTKI